MVDNQPKSPPRSPHFGYPWARSEQDVSADRDDLLICPGAFASDSFEHILPPKTKLTEAVPAQQSTEYAPTSDLSSAWRWCMAPNPGNSCHPWDSSYCKTRAWRLDQQIKITDQRTHFAILVQSNCFAFCLATFIVCSTCTVVYAVDARARDESTPDWMHVLTALFVALYVGDIILRFHISMQDFFSEFWNTFDVVWVLCEVIAEIVDVCYHESSLMSLVHAFRFGRILRIIRVLLIFEDFLIIVQSVLGAARRLLWSSFLLAALLVCCSVLAVEFLHPLSIEMAAAGAYDDCPRCKDAFQSVMSAALTLFSTVIAGDNWDALSTPMMKKYPLSAILFFFVVFVMQFCVLGVIFAVSVDCLQLLRTRRAHHLATSGCQRLEMEKDKLAKLCGGIEAGGTISLEQFVRAFDDHVELSNFFSLLDIHRKDLVTVFNLCKLMNINGSNEIGFSEFVDELISLKMMSPQRMVLYNSSAIHSRVSSGLRALWGRTLEISNEHSKQLRRIADLMCSSLSRKQSSETDVAFDGQEGSRPSVLQQRDSDSGLPKKPKVPETPHKLHLPISNGLLEEDEIEKCMNRLRQCMENELNAIREAIRIKLRQDAALHMQASGRTFAVVDEPRQPIWSGRPKDSARLQNQVWLAEQVQSDLVKFQHMINDGAFAAASKIGNSFPDSDIARDYQIALVQLQLHLNDGLSGAIADVVAKINPAAGDELQSGDFCKAPHTPSRHPAGQCGLLTPACNRLIIKTDSCEQT